MNISPAVALWIGGGSPTLVSMLFVQGLLAAILFTLVGAAYYRRRSLPYLLVWVATSTLLIEAVFGAIGFIIPFNPQLHILIDYVLDILLVSAVLGAIHYARTVKSPHNSTHESN